MGLELPEALEVREKLAQIALHPHGSKEPDYTMGRHAAEIWWAMCCTGMGATEYWGEWKQLGDRVRIVGTKRPGRRWGSIGREVPLLTAILPPPQMTKERFEQVVRKVGVSPYQGRKTYAMWMEDAEIPRTRRRMYLGHGVKDVTDHYERRDITRFLHEDRGRMLNHANLGKQGLSIVKN